MAAPLTSKARVVAAADKQLSTTFDGEVVILGVESGIYYGLTDVGAYIWELIAKPQTIDEVVRSVLATFDVTREVAEHDVLQLLTSLADQQLIDVDAASGP
jgi:hypothetical protein